MIEFLRRFYPSAFLADILKQDPAIRGCFHVETREGGKLRESRDGWNIWTLTGREYLSELITLSAINPTREVLREDRIAYIGMGTGAQPEVSNIQSLVVATPYRSTEFLAKLAVPPVFPSSGTGTAKTSVQFVREFGTNELSLGFSIVLSEAGLFTDGDPDNNFSIALPFPSSMAAASGRSPMAYKTFEPITKTMQFSLRVVWEVRFV